MVFGDSDCRNRSVVPVGLLALGLLVVSSKLPNARTADPVSAPMTPRPATLSTAIHGLPPAAWERMRSVVERDQYRALTGRSGVHAWNHAQQFQSTFDDDGVLVKPVGTKPSWRWGLRFKSYGYGTTQVAGPSPTVVTQENRIEYRRDDLVEWFVNSPDGLEHGFDLRRPPGPRRPGVPLDLRFAVVGDLLPSSSAGGKGVSWHGNDGEEALHYRKLVAWDSTGRTLDARIKNVSGELIISVDDMRAEYPIVIDPLIEQATLVPSSSVEKDEYGYKVAISGNTAVVAAPGIERVVFGPFPPDYPGAVYVFERHHGGPNAWGEVARLVPSDPTDYSFGGDVDIDLNHIIVGSNFLTSSTAEPVGAAYIFRRNLGGRNAWGEAARLPAPAGFPSGFAFFGASVAIGGDHAIVAASDLAFSLPYGAGAAYVYSRHHGGRDQWGMVARLTGEGGPGGSFGYSVDIDADTAVVGSFDPPAASVFERDAGGPDAWGLTKTFGPSDPFNYFSDSTYVAIDGDNLLVSNEVTTLRSRHEGGPNAWGTVAEFPRGVAIALDGDRVMIDRFFFQGVGVYARNQGGPDAWGQIEQLDVSAGGRSGLAADTMVIRDRVYVFDTDGDGERDGEDGCPRNPLKVRRTWHGCRQNTRVFPSLNQLVTTVSDWTPSRPRHAPWTISGYGPAPFIGAFGNVGRSVPPNPFFWADPHDNKPRVTVTTTNISDTPIRNPFFAVSALPQGVYVLNGDGGPRGVGATLSPDTGDAMLSPGESTRAVFILSGHSRSRRPVHFAVDVHGALGH